MRGSREEGQREMWCEGETEGRKERRRNRGGGVRKEECEQTETQVLRKIQ